jgi:hypothetical protein
MRLLPAVAAFALAALLVVALAQSRGPRSAAPRVRAALSVSGGVRSLFPGARSRLPLVVRSNRGFRIRVVSLTVRVRNARRGCGRKYLRVGHLRRALVVPPRGFRTLDLPVTMLRSAPDACKRAVWPLRFTVRGRRA